ncbi:MAG TPA: fatty acid--CoA ligase [Chloroflexota bacterium]|nr:fatty acid--CoA ligase [Chloroflexota bacterium]
MFVPLSPIEFLRRAERLYPEQVAVVDGARRFTYREYAERAHRLANALLDLGLGPGDRVAYLSYNSYPLLEGYFGVLEAGGILLPINIRLSAGDIAYILNDAAATFLLADHDFAPVVDTIWPSLQYKPAVVWLSGVPHGYRGADYDALLRQASPAGPEPSLDENSVAELFYTSGTTGRPKGVMLSHRALYLHALNFLTLLPTDEQDVQLHTIPLFHVNGWGTPQILPVVGARHVMLRRFDPGEALRLIEEERITRLYAVPTMLTMMINHPDVDQRNLESLKVVLVGGGPIAPELLRQAEETLGCRVIAGYGLSETSPVIALVAGKAGLEDLPADERIRRQASTGLPLTGVDLRVVDDSGREVAADGQAIGEIVVRSNVVMTGYWRDDEATRDAMRGGWFHTGDMAVVDGEGYVQIVDRKKDIIISGGENISSVEIENALYAHPAVLECAVIGVPDEQWGEVPLALVALKPGKSAGESDLIAHCRLTLAGFKVPRSVRFREGLPKGGTGKILKRELREPFWSGQERRVH